MCWMDRPRLLLTFVFQLIIRTASKQLDSRELHKTQQNISIMPLFLGKQALPQFMEGHTSLSPKYMSFCSGESPQGYPPYLREVWFICLSDPTYDLVAMWDEMSFLRCWPQSFRHTGKECVLEHVSQRCGPLVKLLDLSNTSHWRENRIL